MGARCGIMGECRESKRVSDVRGCGRLGQYIGALVELCRAANGAQGASSGRRASSDQQCWWARKASATLAAA